MPTKIVWVQGPDGELGEVVNPVCGCSPASQGCMGCWASRLAATRLAHLDVYKGLTTKDGVWTGETRWVQSALERPLRRKKPTGFLWVTMGDLFHESVSDERIAACFGVMAATPRHVHYVLSKRVKRMREWFKWAASPRGGSVSTFLQQCGWSAVPEGLWPMDRVRNTFYEREWPLPNVRIGMTVENQDCLVQRWEDFIKIHAASRYISGEPLVSDLDFGERLKSGLVDAVLFGGESGDRARDCRVEWIRHGLRQCAEAGVIGYCKQLGARPIWNGCSGPGQHWPEGTSDTKMFDSGKGNFFVRLNHRAGADPSEWPDDLKAARQWFPLVK